MRALVTGSTGLLGNNLVRTLIDAGHEVWALARSKEKAQCELGDTAARVDGLSALQAFSATPKSNREWSQ
jgi:uncharacterized protein YbjT (DUF2867 family)